MWTTFGHDAGSNDIQLLYVPLLLITQAAAFYLPVRHRRAVAAISDAPGERRVSGRRRQPLDLLIRQRRRHAHLDRSATAARLTTVKRTAPQMPRERAPAPQAGQTL